MKPVLKALQLSVNCRRKAWPVCKIDVKNHHATCDVDVLESCVYLSTFLILALDGGDWSPAPIGQDMVVAKWMYSHPYWESNSSCVAGSLVTVYNYSGFYLITLLHSTLYCKGCSGSNACAKVSCTSGVTLKGNLSHIVCRSWASICRGVQLGKCGLHGALFKMDDLSQNSSNHKQLLSFWYMKMQFQIGIHCHVLAFYGDDTVYISTVHCWVRKSSSSSRNLDLNNQQQSGRPVTATVIGTGKKLTSLLKKINSKTYMKPLKRFKYWISNIHYGGKASAFSTWQCLTPHWCCHVIHYGTSFR